MSLELSPPHVLVIDDEPMIAELMRELLEEKGFRVSTRSDVPADPDEIEDLQPSLIILDGLRPGQTAGWSRLERLKRDAETQAVPTVLCTGAARSVEALGQPLALMGVAVVLKPFDIDELLAVVQAALPAQGLI